MLVNYTTQKFIIIIIKIKSEKYKKLYATQALAFAVNECAPICAFASLVGIPIGITASAIVLKCVQQQQELKIKVKIKKKKGR